MKLPRVTKHYCGCLSEYNVKAEMNLKYGTDCKQQYLCFIFTFFSLWFMGMPKILRSIRGLTENVLSLKIAECATHLSLWNHLTWTAWMRNLDISFGYVADIQKISIEYILNDVNIWLVLNWEIL